MNHVTPKLAKVSWAVRVVDIDAHSFIVDIDGVGGGKECPQMNGHSGALFINNMYVYTHIYI